MDYLKAFLKFLMSFRKKAWSLDDYPLRYRDQGNAVPPESRWSVQIINWYFFGGLGPSRESAYQNLKSNFQEYLTSKKKAPRPGTKVSLQFASTSRLDHHPDICEMLLSQVFGFKEDDPVFISDDSSLFNFGDGASVKELQSKIKEVFGVDVSDIESGSLADIVERIANSS